jgi:CrcB protein
MENVRDPLRPDEFQASHSMSVTPLVPTPAMVTSLTTWGQAGLVAAGGTAGCLARWRAGVWLNTMPWPIAAGTLAVNMIGGLLIGFSLVAFARAPSEAWRLLLVTGFLGGMTTFSAFTGESLSLLVKGQFAIAAFHTAIHVFGSLAAAALGWQIGRWVLG